MSGPAGFNDPITFAVVKAAIDSIADEMAYTVMRTARSPIVRDVLDYSTTLCDAEGRIFTQAKTVALHLGAVPEAMQAVIAAFGATIRPGDVFILNDPYAGGMHLPDIFMFKPAFLGEVLLGFAVVIAHHCDMGGRVPGSNASDSTEIYQEGLRIPPSRLYREGVADETLLGIIAANVRLPKLVLGDLEAQHAACAIGERQLVALAERHGAEPLRLMIDALIDYAERLTRDTIATWPRGTWHFVDHIDDDGFDERPIPIAVAITVEPDRLIVDFEGTSPQVRGAINSTRSFTKSATYLSVRCAMAREIPNNAGVFRCIEVRIPKGSILDPHHPAPVAARALTGYRVVDAMFGCLAQIVPDRMPAAGEGGNSVVSLGGRDGEGRPFVLVDMINGAWGARPGKDGVEGITNPSQNMSNTPVEVLEARLPVRIDAYGFAPDSGGPGRHRGGLGLVRSYRLLAEEAVLQLRADRVRFAPFGLSGGGPALPTENRFERDGAVSPLPGKVTMVMRRGDALHHRQAGGGGFGDPALRDYDRIDADLADGKVTAAHAERHYRVAVAGGRVDRPASDRLRAGS